jgi:hypothetical protein
LFQEIENDDRRGEIRHFVFDDARFIVTWYFGTVLYLMEASWRSLGQQGEPGCKESEEEI